MTDLFRRFTPRGIAAIDPLALAVDYPAMAGPVACEPAERPDLAVVQIRGPLTYELTAPQFFDTYDLIRCRFDAALGAQPKALALRIGSPGGDVSGSFELARYMRAKAKAAGVRLIAHSESQICSASYVLACAADEIYCTETASIGSIGVIVQPCDTTRADAAAGLKYEIISSGERKADGNPHVALSPEARDAIQATVDTMAGVFFSHVGDARGDKLTAAAARGLQAGVRIGHAALGAGLVDGVKDWAVLCDELCAKPAQAGGTIAENGNSPQGLQMTVAARASAEPDDKDKDKDKAPKEDAVRASLVTASTSDDEKKAARAKLALAAYDSEENDDDKKKKDDEKAQAAATAAATAAASVTLATVAAQAAAATAELAAMKATAEATERAALFASRKDLPEAAINAVRALPVATARAILASLPVITNPLAPVALTATVGDPSAAIVSPLSAAESAALDAQFGIGKPAALGVTVVGGSQFFGVPVPAAINGAVK